MNLRKYMRALKRDQKQASYKPNGKREVARRLRQIAAGQLKVTPERRDEVREAA
jgi:hypothetical protein